MSEEELVDYIVDLDKILSEAEDKLENKKYAQALSKLKEARELIDDLRQEDCADDTKTIGSKVMNKQK